ncbi:MAG TPA: cation:proton antiporter [Ideonella sp.]|nr:cation:proton antiporter [Ideonella sp.]
MLIAAMLLVGAVLVGVALLESPVRRLPLSSALVYLVVGWAAAALAPGWIAIDLAAQGPVLLVLAEWTVLISLFSIGLKLGKPSRQRAWRVATLLASTGMLATVVLATLAAQWLLGLEWAAALLLAAILAPTDPVLASDVQIQSDTDRDAVRLTLTAEGALNDGTAFPLVMLALAALGLHGMGVLGRDWLLWDLLWPIGGGVAIGLASGRAIGWAVRHRHSEDRPLSWDELLYIGCIAVTYGVATSLHASAFLAVFFAGVSLFSAGRQARAAEPADAEPPSEAADLPHRMMAFGERCERLVEVLMVLVMGAALTTVHVTPQALAFAALFMLGIRPLAAWLGVWPKHLPGRQRLLIAWFGIRGVGSLFYLVYALQHGLRGEVAQDIVSATLICIAMSILMHGVSATPLMNRYRRQRGRR